MRYFMPVYTRQRMAFVMVNIPNVLSFCRICLVPAIAAAFFKGGEYRLWIAAGLVLLSGITDILDGYIARKAKMVTKLGCFLDPFADKLTQMAVIVCMWLGKLMPPWLPVVYAAKELLMAAGGLVLSGKYKKLPVSKWYGKTTTVFFYLMAIAFLTLKLSGAVAAATAAVFAVILVANFFLYLREYLRLKNSGADIAA